jgi:uncharacterized protein (DUF1697 family)
MTASVTRIALLRAVNVGGRTVKMAELKAMAETLGFGEVRSLLQSGNLVFAGEDADDVDAEARLEAAAEARFGFAVDFIVRRAPEWDAMIAANPFAREATDDPGHLLVFALKAEPADGALARLAAAIKGRERAAIVGRHAYIVYPDGVGSSKLTIGVIERSLGVRATGRNWNTVQKLAAMAAG